MGANPQTSLTDVLNLMTTINFIISAQILMHQNQQQNNVINIANRINNNLNEINTDNINNENNQNNQNLQQNPYGSNILNWGENPSENNLSATN